MLDNLGNLFPKPAGDFSRGETAGFIGIFAAVVAFFYFTGLMPVALVPILLVGLTAFFVAWSAMAMHQWSRQMQEQDAVPTPGHRAVIMIEELRRRAEDLPQKITDLGNGAFELDEGADLVSRLVVAADQLTLALHRYRKGLLTGEQLNERVDNQLELLELPLYLEPKLEQPWYRVPELEHPHGAEAGKKVQPRRSDSRSTGT